MFCVNCGNKLIEAADFCAACGKIVQQGSDPPISFVPLQRPQRLTDSKREAKNSVFAEPVVDERRRSRSKRLQVSAVAVTLVALIAGIWMFTGRGAIQTPDPVVLGTDSQTHADPSTQRLSLDEEPVIRDVEEAQAQSNDTGIEKTVVNSLDFYFSETSIKGLSQAYGFLLGQKLSLERINKEYPDLSTTVFLVNVKFNSSFPNILTRVRDLLIEELGQGVFDELDRESRGIVGDFIQNQVLTGDLAEEFLRQVSDRAEGHIESPIFEYLLSVNYLGSPVREFTVGYRHRFNSKGHTKAQGLEVVL